jgi:hypothetical protein
MTGSYQGVIERYKNVRDEGVKAHFQDLPNFLNHCDRHFLIVYLFAQLENAHNTVAYCGIVKGLRVDGELVKSTLQRQSFTPEFIQRLFKDVFEREIPIDLRRHFEIAQGILKIGMSGLPVTARDLETAVVNVLEYAEKLNDYTDECAGLRVVGGVRGFEPKGEALDRRTSGLVLKGLGLRLG